MATIPNYNRRVTPDMSGGASQASGRDLVGSAIGQLGGAAMGLGMSLRQKEQNQLEFEEKIRAQNLLAQGQQEWGARLQDYEHGWQPGNDFTPEFNKDYDRWVRENLSTFKTEGVRNMFNGTARNLGVSFNNRGIAYQTEMQQNLDLQSLNDNLRQVEANIYTDSSTYDVSIVDFEQTLSLNQTLNPAQKADLMYRARNGSAFAYNSARINGGPNDFASRYGAGMARALGQTYTNPQSRLSEKDQALINNFNLDPGMDGALRQAAGDDEWTYQLLRAALIVENRGFGQVRTDAVNNSNANGTSDYGAFQINSETLSGYGLTPEDALNFNKSLPVMIRYAQDLKRQYNGNMDAALAHYNGGGKAGQAVLQGNDPFNAHYLNLARAARGDSEGNSAQDNQTFELPEHWDDLTFPQQQALFNQMQSAQRAQATEFNNVVKSAYEQSMASLEDGKPLAPELIPYLSPDMLRSAYGISEGDRKLQALVNRNNALQVRGALSGMTRAELTAIQQWEASPGSTYKEDQATVNAATTAASDLVTAWDNDPVSYLIRNNASVDNIAQTRARLQNEYIRSTQEGNALVADQIRGQLAQVTQANDALLLEEQQRFEGTPLYFGQARFLSTQESQQLSSVLNNAGPDDVVAVINDMNEMHGPYFAQAYGEAFSNGNVNYNFMPIATADPRYYRDLVYAARRNTSDMRQLPTKDNDPTGLRRRIDEHSYRISQVIDPYNALRPEASKAYENLMTNIAFDLASKGLSNADAADKAYEMVTSNYVIDGSLMIPRSIVNRRENAGLWDSWSAGNVQSRVRQYAQNYINNHLSDVMVMDSDTRMYGAQTSDILRTKLQNLSFYSTPDDSGVMVYAVGPNGNGHYPIRGRDGQQLVFTWDAMFGALPTVESDREAIRLADESWAQAMQLREEE